jgi:ubiquinone/menaquinone biosynthesis C-methylase UbiE
MNPDYGIDAPGVIRNLLLAGLAAVAIAWLAPRFMAPAGARRLGAIGMTMGIVFAAQALLMLWTSLRGKRIAARQLVDRAGLIGGENLLAVGCGRGLLLIEAARRLSRGRASGLDLWNAEDLSGNTHAAAQANARAAGVDARVALHDGDMRAMPFGDGEFDVVLSSMAIHNVYDAAGRRQALAEIVRVLRPGGVALLQDFRHTREYVAALSQAGLVVHRRLVAPWLMYPLTWRVEARKPG